MQGVVVVFIAFAVAFVVLGGCLAVAIRADKRRLAALLASPEPRRVDNVQPVTTIGIGVADLSSNRAGDFRGERRPPTPERRP